MKRKDLFTLLLLVIVAIFGLSLIACGGGGGKSNPTGPTDTSTVAPHEVVGDWVYFGVLYGGYTQRLGFDPTVFFTHESWDSSHKRYATAGKYSFQGNSVTLSVTGYFSNYDPAINLPGNFTTSYSVSGNKLTFYNWRGEGKTVTFTKE